MVSEEKKVCCDCIHFGGGNWLDPAGFYCEEKGKWLDDYNDETDSDDTSPSVNCKHYKNRYFTISKEFTAKVISARRLTIPNHVYEEMNLVKGDLVQVKLSKVEEKTSIEIRLDKINKYDEDNKIIQGQGVIKNLRIKLRDQPGTRNKITFTLMMNDKPTDLTVTLTDEETDVTDTIHEVTVTDKDILSLQF